MKTSMKLMVMTLVVAMLLSMSAFAASVSYVGIDEPVLNGTDYTVKVNYTATGYAAGDQVTLLVLVDSADIVFDENDATVPTNVIYIDQQTISADSGSFTFAVAQDVVANKDVYVKLGATAQNAAVGNNEAIKDFVSGGASEDTVLTEGTNVTIASTKDATEMGDEIGKIYALAITDPALEGKVPQAFVGETAVGTVLFSTQRNKYIVIVPVANKDSNVTLKAVDAANATVTNFVYGDVNGKDDFTANDSQMMVQKLKKVRDNINTVAKKIAADVNADGSITANDVQAMTQSLKKVRDFAILKK